MALHGILAKAATTVVTGAVGVAAYERCARRPPKYRSAKRALRLPRGRRGVREKPKTARKWRGSRSPM
jgi:hypothetical protein